MGTLFERALEPEQRSQLGAHYTSEADIKTLVEPVLMQPFRREWAALKGELLPLLAGGASVPASRSARLQHDKTLITSADCDQEEFQFQTTARRFDFARLREKSRGRRDHARFADDKWSRDYQRRLAG